MIKCFFRSPLLSAILVVVGCGPTGPANNNNDSGPFTNGGDAGAQEVCPEIVGELRGVSGEMDLVFCGDPDLVVNYQQDLGAYEGCEVIRPRISLAFFGGEDLPELESVRKTERNLVINRARSLKSIHGLRRLEVVGGAFVLDGAPELLSLEGLGNLREVVQGVGLWNLPNIDTLYPLRNLEVTEGFSIMSLRQLTSLDGLESLCRVEGDLEISETGISREELDAFLQRVEVTGTVTFNREIISL